jgi:RimJ/RimL family protein N-acetyltransferase
MQQLIELRGGPTVAIRPATSEDGPAVAAYLERLDDRARYFRFLQATPRIRGRLVEMFASSGRRLVLVAVAGDEVVGEAMLVVDALDGRRGEIAFSVAERLRRRGLARAMVAQLLDAARTQEVRWLRADIMGENRASVALLDGFGAKIHFEDGLLVAGLEVDEPGSAGAIDVLATMLAC